MVLHRLQSMHPFLKVVRHCFVILDGCCTLHRRCCTLWISILRRAITLDSFRVTGAITSQNEGIYEFYSYDGFHPSLVSFIPKKSYPNLNRVMEVFYPLFFRHVDFSVKRDPRGWSMIYRRWRVVHHGTAPFQFQAPISKSRTALFRHFGRMLHLAPWMLHPVDIDYTDDHKLWLV